jgi:hypothetical protein
MVSHCAGCGCVLKENEVCGCNSSLTPNDAKEILKFAKMLKGELNIEEYLEFAALKKEAEDMKKQFGSEFDDPILENLREIFGKISMVLLFDNKMNHGYGWEFNKHAKAILDILKVWKGYD